MDELLLARKKNRALFFGGRAIEQKKINRTKINRALFFAPSGGSGINVMNIKEGKSCILSSTFGVFVFMQQISGTCFSFHIPKIQGTDNTKHCLN